ncbi:WD40 repeat-like protein [Rhizopus microsporus var. microsporus]|uniref:WD40 repeat-like protein n=2 Tax=Rhizopus microsporus TaxID=58291 RepID=A0A2G4T281_RHIZD|nr:WD40 repeat-like protein [Rhizopus microsporus ATCC 52813]ORE05442.1 WD40 repeat-like protein [Rhizopus microsporus var. microsporus]PHZ15123.1 WD40 repeat-like protein [Rhizopus microsporus ATCC 52813]
MTVIDTEDISPPATPPTHSPIPHRLDLESCALLSQCDEKEHLSHLVSSFQLLTPMQKQLFLYEIINHCDNGQLTFLNSLIAPRLKVDFLKELPPEIALNILSYIDNPATLAHASRISKYWNSLVKDETVWKVLCKRHEYIKEEIEVPASFSFRDHFKRNYGIHRAWRQGGKVTTVDGGFSHGLVTSLQFDEKFTVVGCDNHRIEVFDTNSGKKIRTLEGHEGGVWALQFKGGEQDDPERVLLSGGCDRDVRVWDLNQGKLKYILRGHTSTVRCLKIRDKQIAVTGSRDATLRVWDIQRGVLLHILVGHQASVRCVDIHGDIAVSGSYDFTARVWDLKTGRCKHVLVGHTLQIYTIVTNGKIIATGAMDAHIRIWSVETGECLATLHGHTSLVGQLQLSGTTLVSGGADGCLRVWDMETFECKQQFSAHDNSITCLQFDDQHILSAANDGKVKLWDIKRGRLIRNFTQPSKIVWKIQFNQTKAVVLMQRKRPDDEGQGKTVMEIHDFDLLSPSSSSL